VIQFVNTASDHPIQSDAGLTEIGKAMAEVLARSSYDEQNVRDLVRVDNLDLGRGLAVLPLRPSGGGPLGLLVRLFLGADVVDAESVAAALAPVTLDQLAAAGLVERSQGGIRSLIRLDPVDGLVVASDPQRPRQRIATDHVISVGPASRTLAAVTVRRQTSTALDLCCGSGIQALLAARHCKRVVGTDLNPRALRLAVLSAALSGVENVEWRLGDLLEPVASDRFDLVVSNPPFVVSPANEFMYRDGDGGRHGDDLSHRVLAGMMGVLSDGGFGHLLCSWVNLEGEHWTDTPRRWLEAGGCDALILRLSSETPETYAISWTSSESSSADEAVDRASEWIAYYRDLQIAEITTGAIVLRRRQGANWVAAEELISAGSGGGRQVERMFTGNDALAGPGGERELLEMTLELPSEVRLVERSRAGVVERARLTADGGLHLPGRISPPDIVGLVRRLDGRRTLAAAAAEAGLRPPELDAAIGSVADLVRRGYLEATSARSAAGQTPSSM
jgi:SAM-dependent methyltransferase